jgi:hypothetical protein
MKMIYTALLCFFTEEEDIKTLHVISVLTMYAPSTSTDVDLVGQPGSDALYAALILGASAKLSICERICDCRRRIQTKMNIGSSSKTSFTQPRMTGFCYQAPC